MPWNRLSLSVQLQQAFLDTLVRLASSADTAMALLPERLRLTIQKMLATTATHSSRAAGIHRGSSSHSLQFDAVVALLLPASSACGMPWAVVYLSYTVSEAPHLACGLRAVMVDQQASQAPGGHTGALGLGLPLFSVEQLAPTPAAVQAAGNSIPPGAAASNTPTSTSPSHPAAQATPAGAGLGQPAGQAGEQPVAAGPVGSGSRRSRLQQEDQEEEGELEHEHSSPAAAGKLSEGWGLDGDPLATLAGAGLVRTWVHVRLRCARVRAAARLRRQLTPLERLQQEAQAVLGP